MVCLASGVIWKRSESSSSGEAEGEVVEEGEGEVVGEGEGVVVVSIVKMTELLESEPSRLLFPEESENFELATEITPSVVLFSVGVKVAV